MARRAAAMESGSPVRENTSMAVSANLITCSSLCSTVECGLEDWFAVTGAAVDRGDGDDHVEDLIEREVVADLVSGLRGGEERPRGASARACC
jgi:hypothetical protein